MTADLQNFAITQLPGSRYQVECDVVEPRRGGAVLRSHRGGTAIEFPRDLVRLTADQRQEIINVIIPMMVRFLTPEAGD